MDSASARSCSRIYRYGENLSRKILLLGPESSIHLKRWITALCEKGFEVQVATLHEDKNWQRPNSAVIHVLPFPSPLGYGLNIFRLKKLLKDFKPDILHAHYASGYGTLGRLAGYKNFIISVWGKDVYEFPFTSFLHMKLICKNLENAKWICSTSKVMASQTLRLANVREKISVVPFGVDTQVFSRKSEPVNLSLVRIGIVKTLEPKYGIDALIRAFAQVLNTLKNKNSGIEIELHIYGKGYQQALLEALSQSLGVKEKVFFHGFIQHEKVPQALQELEIFAAPSREDSESFGVAVIEASSCGLPVVVTNVGGLPEVVKNDLTGIIVEKDNIEQLAQALQKLVENPDLRSKMGTNGRAWVEQNYEWHMNVAQMLHIYSQLTSRI
jgi:glycosyltransferase involved in cell wall biosynthesis